MKSSEFNQWPGYSKIKIPAGQEVIFKVTGIRPDIESGNGSFIIPSKNIPTTDVIYKDGEIWPIGCFIGTQANGDPIHDLLVFDFSTAGTMKLRSGVARDEARYRYLSLCNYNASNTDRDASYEEKFTLVNEGKSAEQKLASDKLVFEAQSKFWELSGDSLKNVFTILGIDQKDSNIAKSKLKDFVDENPGEFIKLLDSGSKKNESLAQIKDALKKKILRDNYEGRNVLFGEDKIVVYEYPENSNKLDVSALAQYLEAEKKEIFDSVILLLSK